MRAKDRLKLIPVLAREAGRRAHLRWRLLGWSGLPLPTGMLPKQTIVLKDLHPAEPEQAAQYYSGHFAFGGHIHDFHGDSPFTQSVLDSTWLEELHGFGWLRNLAAVNTPLARAQGSAMIGDWIRLCDRKSQPIAFHCDVVANRLMAWCRHSEDLMRDAGSERRREMRRSIATQTRHLMNILPALSIDRDRLKVTIALCTVALCFGSREKPLKAAQRDLVKEIDRQILADGGHISRNPSVPIDILADLWPLVRAFEKAGLSPHESIINAVDRLAGALRFFRHADGTLAQFNGTGHPSPALLKSLLDEKLPQSQSQLHNIQKSAPFSGYERLSSGGTIVIVDTGAPLSRHAARDAAAGCLAFELSSGKNRFIINVGQPAIDADLYAPYWRVTAAHSTASINGQSSMSFAKNPRLAKTLPSPALVWPESVNSERRMEEGYDILDASHNGYDRQGVIHRRQIQMSKDGRQINGLDRFEPVEATHMNIDATLRFHLPPTISASILSNGHSILLAAPDREAWVFTCIDAPIALEESVHFANESGPRKSEQIVVRKSSETSREIRWTLQRRVRRSGSRSKSTQEKAPDLLSGLENERQDDAA